MATFFLTSTLILFMVFAMAGAFFAWAVWYSSIEVHIDSEE